MKPPDIGSWIVHLTRSVDPGLMHSQCWEAYQEILEKLLTHLKAEVRH